MKKFCSEYETVRLMEKEGPEHMYFHDASLLITYHRITVINACSLDTDVKGQYLEQDLGEVEFTFSF